MQVNIRNIGASATTTLVTSITEKVKEREKVKAEPVFCVTKQDTSHANAPRRERGKERQAKSREKGKDGKAPRVMEREHLPHINITIAERTDIGLPIAEVAKSWGPRSTSTKHRPKKQFQSASSEE